MKHIIPCPRCKKKGKVGIEENLLGDKVYVLRCRECGGTFVSRDGIHWSIVMQNNTKKEAK